MQSSSRRASSLTLPTGSVTAESAWKPLVERPEVERDDVALLEDALGRGDAVHDLVVDRDADRGREAVEPLERGARAQTDDGLLGDLVDLGRRLAGPELLADRLEHRRDDAPALLHQLELALRLEHDRHRLAALRAGAVERGQQRAR